MSRDAIISANYLRKRLSKRFTVSYPQPCMHEFVLSGNQQKARGVSTAHIAKRLLDFGVHAPTVYFPLLVPEALMIEPTETESKETLDQFAEIMLTIDEESKSNPDIVRNAPHTTPVKSLMKPGLTQTKLKVAAAMILFLLLSISGLALCAGAVLFTTETMKG